ncbi:MAG: hypothetical protein DRP54_09285 [Spirochaetes bacterium]|nr:MAG: hypothetical protein DRP54_09285 [Spirochaetota bacterium]
MFRRLSKKVFEPLAMGLIGLGIVSLCQPWVLLLHRKGFLITGIGLAMFIFFSHVKPPEEEEKHEEESIEDYIGLVG